MPNLYDSERDQIYHIGLDLNKKWAFVLSKLPDDPIRNDTARKMIQQWHDEAINRYQEAGWLVEVDVTPALAGIAPPTISIVDRVQKIEFDHDKLGYEITKSNG